MSLYYLVCFKGSFNPYCFSNGNYIKSNSFQGTSWELSCYYHNTGYFLVFYGHNGDHSLYYERTNNQDFKK